MSDNDLVIAPKYEPLLCNLNFPKAWYSLISHIRKPVSLESMNAFGCLSFCTVGAVSVCHEEMITLVLCMFLIIPQLSSVAQWSMPASSLFAFLACQLLLYSLTQDLFSKVSQRCIIARVQPIDQTPI